MDEVGVAFDRAFGPRATPVLWRLSNGAEVRIEVLHGGLLTARAIDPEGAEVLSRALLVPDTVRGFASSAAHLLRADHGGTR